LSPARGLTSLLLDYYIISAESLFDRLSAFHMDEKSCSPSSRRYPLTG
jgi:hypothetical protein